MGWHDTHLLHVRHRRRLVRDTESVLGENPNLEKKLGTT